MLWKVYVLREDGASEMVGRVRAEHQPGALARAWLRWPAIDKRKFWVRTNKDATVREAPTRIKGAHKAPPCLRYAGLMGHEYVGVRDGETRVQAATLAECVAAGWDCEVWRQLPRKPGSPRRWLLVRRADISQPPPAKSSWVRLRPTLKLDDIPIVRLAYQATPTAIAATPPGLRRGLSDTRPDVVFIREDGWTLGAARPFVEWAQRQWSAEWVAIYERRDAHWVRTWLGPHIDKVPRHGWPERAEACT